MGGGGIFGFFTAVKSKPQATSAAVAGGAGGGAAAPTTGKYVPPSQRGDKKLGERGESFGSRTQQDDQATVRVTNLSEETQESDLRELFGYFGQIRRVFLAKDKITQQSKVGLSWAAGKGIVIYMYTSGLQFKFPQHQQYTYKWLFLCSHET